MALKNKTHEIEKPATKQQPRQQIALNSPEHERPLNPIAALQRATSAPPSALRPADILALQHTIGNRAVQRMLSNQPHALSPQSASAIQLQAEEDEEPLQGKFETAARTEKTLTENRTGLPDNLKAGIENLSGLAMDDVRVHYNSSRPAQVQALAYTQGADIHVGPGHEKHLAHEAWHVVQQKQGRVKPTLQAKEVAINDDQGLEREADVMGERALMSGSTDGAARDLDGQPASSAHLDASGPIQLKTKDEVKGEFDNNKASDNFTQAFTTDHLGSGKNNFDAAGVHSKRTVAAPVNTIILTAPGVLKSRLKTGTWVDGQNRWEVTTQENIKVQSTEQKGNAIVAQPAKPTLLTIDGDSVDDFTMSQGPKVTAVKGVTGDELTTALGLAGRYPTSGKNLSKKRRDYRQKIIDKVNEQRRAPEVTWVKTNFKKIGAKDVDETIKTLKDVNKIDPIDKKVTVHINSISGNIFHFAP